jgi:hypothetical protein
MLRSSMTAAADRRLGTVVRRVRYALFEAGCSEAALVGGILSGAGLLIARLVGWTATPSWSWASAAAFIPAWGLVRAWRGEPDPNAVAAWIDARSGLGGLLVAAREVDAAAWNAELDLRLAAAPAALPRRRDLRAVRRAVAGLAFLAIILALPASAPVVPRTVHPAMTAAVEELQRAFEELRRQDALEPRAAEEVKERLEDAKRRLEEGSSVAWSDVDAIERRLEQARALREDALEAAAAALASFAAGGADAVDAATAAEQLRQALEKAAAVGALDGLPQDLKDRLGAGKAAGGAIDPSAFAKSPEELRKLAREAADLLEGKLEDLAASGLADPEAAKRLAALGKGEWAEADDEHVHTEACAGGA